MKSDSKTRWWPAILIGVVVVVLLGVTFWGAADSSEQIRQSRILRGAGVIVVGAVLMLLWAAFFSRLPGRRRLEIVGAFFAVLLVFFTIFRYRGVSGDLVPQFDLRFQSASENLGAAGTSLPGLQDFPQFLGPRRDGTVEGVHLARDWTSTPPTLLWRRPVGGGWSGFAVVGTRAVTHEQHSEEERVVSYDLVTGRVNWASREVAHYSDPLAGAGPRATPTIRDGRVFAMGGSGILTALDLETGRTLWKHDVLRENQARLPVWGKSNSPLVVDDLVVVSAGGPAGRSIVAYEAASGGERWSAGDDASAYASPMLVTLDGEEQIVSFNHDSLTGHSPQSGAVLWRQPWPTQQPNVAQPILLPGDRLLVSVGYGVGSKLFAITRDAAGDFVVAKLWESVRLKAKFTNLVYYDGFVYGLDDGILVCLDPADGRRRWKRGRYGHGQVLLVGDLLLVQAEHGEIFLVEPDPEELHELGSFVVMDEKTWNSPTLAGRYLLVRTDTQAALFELPIVSEAASVTP